MRVSVYYLFLWVFFISMLIATIYYPLRYFKYVLPIFPLFLFFDKKKKVTVDRKFLSYYVTFLLFYLVVVAYLFFFNVLSQNLSSRFVPNAVFILSPLLFFILILPYFREDKVDSYVEWLFFLSILIYVFEVRSNILDVFLVLKSLASAHMPAEATTESELGFVFGFFVLHFLLRGQKRIYLLVSILFFLISFKRIVIAGVLASLFFFLLLKLFKIETRKNKVAITIAGVLINLSIIYGAQLLVSGRFDDFVIEQTGLSTDAFLLGRKTFYTEVFDQFGSYSLSGVGLGKVDDALFALLGYPMNLHSELIKNYIEFGLILFVVWMSLLIYKNLFSNRAAVFLVYLNVLILTDNIFIYFHGMFYFYFFILVALCPVRTKSKLITQ